MRAAVLARFGAPVSVQHVELAEAREGEVLVAASLRAASAMPSLHRARDRGLLRSSSSPTERELEPP